MELSEVIAKRRAIRKYKKDPIPEEKLERLYQALQAAPTGNNRQPFRFLFVRDAEIRERIVKEACHQDFLLQPPVLMIACCRKGDAFDVAIAVDHLVLAATDEGLGSCWVGWIDGEKIRRILDIPDEYEIPILVPIGYAEEDPPVRPRKPIKEIVTVI